MGTNPDRRGKRPEEDQRALELYEELGSYRLVSERLQTEGITASQTTVSAMVQRAMSRRFEHSLKELDSRDKETIEETLSKLRDADRLEELLPKGTFEGWERWLWPTHSYPIFPPTQSWRWPAGQSSAGQHPPARDSEMDEEGEISVEFQELEAQVEEAIADGNTLDEFEGRSVLVQAYLKAAQPGRAIVHCEALVELIARVEGSESEKLMTWRGFLGQALTEARRYSEAAEVLSELLVDREQIFGSDHRQTLATRGNLSRAVAFGGRIEEGILLAERLLDDRRRLFGDLDPTVLDTLGHLAQFHSLAGNHESAVQLAEEQLEKRLRVCEESDPILERTRQNLAVFRSWTVTPAEAIPEFRDRVENSVNQLGADHPETFTAKGLLAEQLLRSGAFDEAIGQFEELLADRTRVLGAGAPATATTSLMYALALRACDRAADSVAHLRALINTVPTEPGTPSPEHLKIRAELVLSLTEAGDGEGAIAELELLGSDISHLEPTHPLREWVNELFEDLT